MKKIVIEFDNDAIRIEKENLGMLEVLTMLQNVLDSAIVEYNRTQTIAPKNIIIDGGNTPH